MATLRRGRDRQAPRRRRPTVAALALPLALALFFLLLLLLLAPASARPLARDSVPVMREGLSGGRTSGSSSGAAAAAASRRRRRLAGPGSAPPSCRSKCGDCSPCQPVHVPVQPGLDTPPEYHPEAWRCKCGNKLFMP
ncbi:hypothetical protein ACJRO7_010169 [Eucalyptus globulus]|uniref:Epidermal patterning factor-like protein n=1 Tax=Eucalyptus globulus TaxID=34317 RepID=A0ABD3LEM6_EUCGL